MHPQKKHPERGTEEEKIEEGEIQETRQTSTDCQQNDQLGGRFMQTDVGEREEKNRSPLSCVAFFCQDFILRSSALSK